MQRARGKTWRKCLSMLLSLSMACSIAVPAKVKAASGGEKICATVDELESDHNYEDNCDLTWVYTLTGAEYLAVTFDTQTATENGYDYIYILDANDVEKGKYSGTALSGKTVFVKGDTVKINLTSDSAITGWGFKVTSVTATDGTTGTMGVNGGIRWDYIGDATLKISGHDILDTASYGSPFDAVCRLHNVEKIVFEDCSVGTSTNNLFYGLENIKEIDLSGLDTTGVLSMEFMFYNCENLTTLNLSGMDTSTVNMMNSMFFNCPKLTSLDLSGFSIDSGMSVYSMLERCTPQTLITPQTIGQEIELSMYYKDDAGKEYNRLSADNANKTLTRLGYGVSSLYLDQSRLILEKGKKKTISASVYPEDAYNKTLTWSSSDESVATVDANGMVTALAEGNTTITATAHSGAYSTCAVIVPETIVCSSADQLACTYENNIYKTWIYTVEGAENLYVTFDPQTALASYDDSLTVYNMDDDQVGRYSGTSLAGKKLLISGDTVKIVMETGDYGSAWGFKVTSVEASDGKSGTIGDTDGIKMDLHKRGQDADPDRRGRLISGQLPQSAEGALPVPQSEKDRVCCLYDKRKRKLSVLWAGRHKGD